MSRPPRPCTLCDIEGHSNTRTHAYADVRTAPTASQGVPDAEQSDLRRQVRLAIHELCADPDFHAELIFERQLSLLERLING